MKVSISGYSASWNTNRIRNVYFQAVHKKHDWEVYDDDYTNYDKAFEWVCDRLDSVLNFLINRPSRFFARKVKVKIDEFDTWNGDWTLSQIIYPWLVQYKKDNNHTEPTDEEIDAMIFAFKEIAEERSDGTDFHSGDHDIFWVKGINSYKMEHGPNHTHVFDHEGYKLYQEKIQAGLNLFAKNFQGLWT